jgi:hypothetical protein
VKQQILALGARNESSKCCLPLSAAVNSKIHGRVMIIIRKLILLSFHFLLSEVCGMMVSLWRTTADKQN